jgi:hypothetical protein
VAQGRARVCVQKGIEDLLSVSDFMLTQRFSQQTVDEIIKEAPASSSRSSTRIGTKANGSRNRIASADIDISSNKPRSSRGHITETTLTTAMTNTNDTPSIASFVGPAHKPDILCAFCQGTAQYNYKSKRAEALISCAECGSSGECI